MSTKTRAVAATAAEVRAEARSNPAKYADLSAAALHTVAPGAKGRLHPDVTARFNEDRSPATRYKEGNKRTIALTFRYSQPSGRNATGTRNVPEADARALAGDKAGKRGPLSKEAKVAAGEALREREGLPAPLVKA